MRRIYQVLIVGVAVVSLCMFVLYKHEYDRLRGVIRVLNTFGEGKSEACDHNFNPEISYMTTNNAAFGEWRQFDSLRLFSAFWTDDEVRVHGVIATDAPSPAFRDCAVWHDVASPAAVDNFKRLPLRIEREVGGGGGGRQWTLATLVCKGSTPNSVEKTPYSVAFVEDDQASDQVLLTPALNVQSVPSLNSVVVDALAICASVTRGPQMDELGVVQFIEYHRYVGVTRFVIYADGILLPVHQRIQKLAAKYHDLQIEILPWNAPSHSKGHGEEALSVVMKRDCVARLGHKYAFVVFLQMHELLVARYHSHLLNFVKDESHIADGAFGGLRFDRKVFCLEFDDDGTRQPETAGGNSLADLSSDALVGLPPMFKKTMWIESPAGALGALADETYLLKGSALKTISAEGAPVFHSKHAFLKVSRDFASVHSYARCGMLAKQSQAKHDDIVLTKIHDQLF